MRVLKVVRTMAGLTGREVARRAGISNSFLSNVEAGRVMPSLSAQAKIRRALELPDTYKIFPGD